jgi:hypothetical protein
VVVNNVRPTIRLALLVITILTLPIDGAMQRVLGASVVFLRSQVPFVVSINNNVELNLSAIITGVVVLFIIREITGAGNRTMHIPRRGLVSIITPYPLAWLLMVYLITKHPSQAMIIDSTVTIATAIMTTITASLVVHVDYPTLYAVLLIGSLATDFIASVMAGDVYHLGCFVVGYYGPIDGLVSVPVFGTLLALLLNPQTPNPKP